MKKAFLKSVCALLMASAATSASAQISFSEDDICGIYTVSELSALDLEPFGNTGSDWTIVNLAETPFEMTISKADGQLLLTNFFPFEGGNLVGSFNPEDNSITFQPQTTLAGYTFCAYPTVGDWWTNNQIQEDPKPVVATFNLEKTLSFGMWALIKGEKDVVGTCYQSGKFFFSRQASVQTILSDSDDTDAPIFDILGREMNSADISTLPAGIYIRNGKKILVK